MPNPRKPRPNQSKSRPNRPSSKSNKARPPRKPVKKFNPAAQTVTPPPVPEVEPLKPDPIIEYTPPEYVTIAYITSTFGLRGAVKAEVRTDFPERFDRLSDVFLIPSDDKAAEPKPYKVMSARLQNEKIVTIRFEGITKIEQAVPLRGYNITVPIGEVIELPDDEYYVFQIIGLEVYSLEDEYVGRVINVLTYPANDVYVVRGSLSKKDVLIPAVKDIVKQIDLENNRITIDLLEGLI
jgi:16S rRNA processing protein RimM